MAKLRMIGVLVVGFSMAMAAGCKKEVAKAAPPPPVVTVAQPIARDVLDYSEYTGSLAAVNTVEIRARVKGYLDKVGFKDGDEVKQGQELFLIDPKPFDAQVKAAEGQLEQVKARRITADADVKRYRDLVPKGAATAQDLDRAIGQLAEAEAGIQMAMAQLDQAKLDQGYARLTAPIDGVISSSNLSVGNLIASSSGGEQLLTTIVSIDPIYVYFDVDQRALQQIRKNALERRGGGSDPKTIREMNIAFQFGLASEEGYPHEGVLDFIDNKIDSATGTIRVRGTVKNERRLFKPGYFARVRVAVADKYPAVLVSEQAIGTQQGQKYVLVVDDKDTVVLRPVQLGAAQDDGLRVITSGVRTSDRVIVNGVQRARPGSTVRPEAGDMLPPSSGEPATTQSVSIGK